MNSVVLGSFTPDTSERNEYTIRAEMMCDDMQIAQATANYFVSDKSVAITYDTDKDYLTEIDDKANVTINLRDERVVDLIFTTASEDTALINEHSAQIEAIKNKLETMGYAVNLSNVSTSYISAMDSDKWIEYDHIKQPDRYCEVLDERIIGNSKDLQMLGYGDTPYKNFCIVPCDDPSKKILEFDLQRDNSNDWHTLDGGGFLFNISLENQELNGYCVLINNNGLNLYQLQNININDFHEGRACNLVSNKAVLLKRFVQQSYPHS